MVIFSCTDRHLQWRQSNWSQSHPCDDDRPSLNWVLLTFSVTVQTCPKSLQFFRSCKMMFCKHAFPDAVNLERVLSIHASGVRASTSKRMHILHVRDEKSSWRRLGNVSNAFESSWVNIGRPLWALELPTWAVRLSSWDWGNVIQNKRESLNWSCSFFLFNLWVKQSVL